MEDKKSKMPLGRRSFKNLLVDSSMQSRLGMNIVAINFCVAGIGLFILIQKIQALRMAIEETPGLSETGSESLASALIGIVAVSFILIIVSAAVNYLAGIYLAHRFAAPTKIIVQFIDDLIVGKPTSRRELRPTDELKPILAKLHELADKLEKRN